MATSEPALKRTRTDTGPARCSADKPPLIPPSLETNPERLVRLVLRKAGRHIEQAMTKLRERVGAGRKVHGQQFSMLDVAGAIRLFRVEQKKAEEARAAQAAAQQQLRSSSLSLGAGGGAEDRGTADAAGDEEEPRALQPFRSKAQPLAYQGSFMPPAAVSRLVGDEPCAICLEPLRQQAQTIALCGHIFHRACLNEAGGERCPTCRQPMDMGRESFQELKTLVLLTRRDASYSNVLEFSRQELLADCNKRRSSGHPLFSLQTLEFVLTELARERPEKLLIEEDLVSLFL